MQFDCTPRLRARLAARTERTEECWQWTGTRTPKGYGRISLFSAQEQRHYGEYAHRVAWVSASNAPIPDGHFVCHTCDTPACVRNDDPGIYIVRGIAYPRWGHLFCAPLSVNIADRDEKGRGGRGNNVPPLLWGENNPFSKLTISMVREIRRKYARQEMSQRDLGLQFGVSHYAIYACVKRLTWKHVEDEPC